MDTFGIVIRACISPAGVGDREGVMVLLSLLGKGLARLRCLWVDAGYRGAFVRWARQVLGVAVEITQRRGGGFRRTWARVGAPPRVVPCFAVVPRRWVVEWMFGWFGRWRRLAKDYGYLTATSENAIYLARSLILVRRAARAAN